MGDRAADIEFVVEWNRVNSNTALDGRKYVVTEVYRIDKKLDSVVAGIGQSCFEVCVSGMVVDRRSTDSMVLLRSAKGNG